MPGEKPLELESDCYRTTPRHLGWTSAEKFAAVVETAALNAIELAAYIRQRGLYLAQPSPGGKPVNRPIIGTGVSRDGSRRPAKRISSRSNNWAES